MKNIILMTEGSGIANDGRKSFEALNHGVIRLEADGSPRVASPWGMFTTFPLLPAAAVAAGSEKLLISLGTATEVIARSDKGGINVKTQASSPADNDNAMLIGIATTDSVAPISAVSRIRFATRIRLTALLTEVFGAGMDENLTSPIGSATAGEGFQFLYDPLDELSTGVGEDYQANWILAMKVNGVDTYIATDVKVQAGVDYELVIEVGADLKPVYYINGVEVGTGASALTDGDSVAVVIGIQASGTPAGQLDFDCRYVAVERRIG